MNHFKYLDKWFEQNPPDNNPMVNKRGRGPEGKKCKECDKLIKIIPNVKSYYKCELRGTSQSSTTDHRVGWNACAAFRLKTNT